MRSKKKKNNFLKNLIFSTHGFPIFLVLAILMVSFVVFRMKSIDFDYRTNEINLALERSHIENKDLKAKQARLLSSRHLHELAMRHHLAEPNQKQMIVIP